MSSLKTRRTLCISFLIVLVVIKLTTATQAQTTISVNGTIVDQNKAVLPNAAVQVLNLASGVVSRTTTNSSGRYTLTGLQRGTHRIQVSSTGFAEASRSITWREPGTYTEDFTLVPGVIESSITVTATKGAARASADTPQNVTVAEVMQDYFTSFTQCGKPSSPLGPPFHRYGQQGSLLNLGNYSISAEREPTDSPRCRFWQTAQFD